MKDITLPRGSSQNFVVAGFERLEAESGQQDRHGQALQEKLIIFSAMVKSLSNSLSDKQHFISGCIYRL